MTSLLDAIKARASQAWQYAGQVPAGLIQATVANTARPQDRSRVLEYLTRGLLSATGNVSAAASLPKYYRPAIVETPGTLAAIARVGGNVVAPKHIDPLTPDSYAGRSIERMSAGIDRTNKALGIKDPENAAQVALNVAGSLAVPIKVPGATAATKVGRFAQNTARVAAEAVLPGRQVSAKVALPLGAGIGVGVKEATEAVAPSGTYSRLFGGKKQEQVEAGDPFGDSAVEGLQSDPFGDAAVAPPADEFGDEAAMLSNFGVPLPFEPAHQQEASTVEKGIVAAGLIAAAGLGTAATRYALKRIRGGAIPQGELVGSHVTGTRSGVGEKLAAGVLQADQPVRNAANEFFTPEHAARVRFNSDRMNGQAQGAKIRHTFMTGELPGSALKIEPLAPLLQATSKALSPAERAALGDGLLARTALDDYNRTGTQAAFTARPDGTPITPADLRQMADAVDNDPKLRPIADAVRGQYKAMLDYRLDQGLITPKMYQELRAARPHYVHMSKDSARKGEATTLFSGNSNYKLDEQYARGVDEASGVQAGAARDPIDELQSRWVAVIRQAQKNAHQLDFLDTLSKSRAANELVPTNDGKAVKLIQELADAPDDMTGVHAVYDQGRARYFKIGDASLDRALSYQAPAKASELFSQMRQVAQFFTTGAGNVLNFFSATVSPVYDTLAGMVLRPQGTDIGVINELMNRLGSPFNLGRLDPTSLISAYVGGARNMFDEVTGSLANDLSDQLIRGHGAILDIVGPQKTTALRDMLKSRYDSSIRSIMDREGVSSVMQYGGDTGRELGVGLHNIAPDYFKDLSRRVQASALAGNHDLYDGILARGSNVFAQAKSSLISRMYTGVLRNMQEGFKYQFLATNLPKVKSMQDLDQLASTARRISVDAAQHGGSDTWNKFADSVMYTNIATQAIGEWGRRLRANPAYVTGNALTTIGTLAALRYGAMISDAEVRDKIANKTDQQNAAAIPTFGGIEIPVEQMLRPITAPLFAFIDSIAMDENGNFNPNFIDAVYNWFDDADENSPQNEETAQKVKDSFLAGLNTAMPVPVMFGPDGTPQVNAGGMPAASALLAAQGIDPGMTRVSGNVSPVRIQQRDPAAGEGKTTDSMISAFWDNLIGAATASGLTSWYHAVDQGQRALWAQNKDGSRASVKDAIKVGLSSLADDMSKTASPVQGALFKDYNKPESIATTDFNIFKRKEDGIDKANKTFNNIRAANGLVTSVDPRYAMLNPIDVVLPEYQNTPLATIGAVTAGLNKDLYKLKRVLGGLGDQVDAARNQKTTKIEERNKIVNDLNNKRKFIYTQMLQMTRQAEDAIGDAIGEPNFTYGNFDPKRYVPGGQDVPQGDASIPPAQ